MNVIDGFVFSVIILFWFVYFLVEWKWIFVGVRHSVLYSNYIDFLFRSSPIQDIQHMDSKQQWEMVGIGIGIKENWRIFHIFSSDENFHFSKVFHRKQILSSHSADKATNKYVKGTKCSLKLNYQRSVWTSVTDYITQTHTVLHDISISTENLQSSYIFTVGETTCLASEKKKTKNKKQKKNERK